MVDSNINFDVDAQYLISLLENKDNNVAYGVLQDLEKISAQSPVMHIYINKFIDMSVSEKYTIKVRGFRLFCKQAKWDTRNLINENLDKVIEIIYDNKPTAVRQALAALKEIIEYKKDLIPIIKERVSVIDLAKYNKSMRSLIINDINNLGL